MNRFYFQSKLVRTCRVKLGLKTTEVSRRLNRAYQQIHHIEKGRKGIPAEIALKWAEILKIEPIKLVKAVTADFRRDYIRRMTGQPETEDVSNS